MQILNTYKIDHNKLNYRHPNKIVYDRVKKLFKLLDSIILKDSKNEIFILSNNYLKLLDSEYFLNNIKNINSNIDDFDKYQKLFYVLIKHKYFNENDSSSSNNPIIVFISISLYKYINKDRDKFLNIFKNIPIYEVFNEMTEKLYEKYNYHIINFIVSNGIFPYLIEPIFDYRRICTYCAKISKVTFIRCSGCRVFHYCSNLCQHKDYKNHKKICPNVFTNII